MFTKEEDLQERLNEWRKEFDKTRKKLKIRQDKLSELPESHKEFKNRKNYIKKLENRLDSIRNKCVSIKYELDKLREQKRLINVQINELSNELADLLEFGLTKQDNIDDVINQIRDLEVKLEELDKL
ncbi:MAG: hypothetical protein J6D47_13220 [Peptostreptococcaceae bacterium]|nr:hypothetical protein [Peptostreptococcaceae bacterium]